MVATDSTRPVLLNNTPNKWEVQVKRRHLRAFLERHGFDNAHRPREVGNGGKASGSRSPIIGMECMYPIHVAAQLADTYTLRMLLEMGVDPQTGAKGGRTPMELAEEADQNGSHFRILQLLAETQKVKSVARRGPPGGSST